MILGYSFEHTFGGVIDVLDDVTFFIDIWKFNLHLHQITIGAFCIRCQQQELYIFIRYHYKYNLNDVMIINHGLTFTQLRIMNYFVIKITRKLIMDACLVNIVLSPLTLSPLLVFNTFWIRNNLIGNEKSDNGLLLRWKIILNSLEYL